MLPTPSTSHVPYARVYEPAEDSFLLLDTLSAPSETAFLATRFPITTTPNPLSPTPTPTTTTPSLSPSPTPLILEIGPGSGVVLAFLTAHAHTLFSRRDVLTLGIDVNRFACAATRETVRRAVRDDALPLEVGAEAASGAGVGVGAGLGTGAGYHLGTAQGDLVGAVRAGSVDVLVFNPPYVPTPELPSMYQQGGEGEGGGQATTTTTTAAAYEEDSRLLALSYAGGRDGMEITDRLIEALPEVLSSRGVAYLLLCAQNKPEEVKGRIRGLEGGLWQAETVGTSGKQAGWEKLQIVRIWRE
ncbi:methyltransferase domain-containing protein [Chaetomium tenue]|uniref:Methyltransferase domain-containing protein n=1 Tax=Chaetomium tenue TaxID=1854479 RepID=A0ACB7P4A1_9PEZI|nr:methyltransferase domain-containing protein [Chaetomium globosum]